jgi:hypothetical protein
MIRQSTKPRLGATLFFHSSLFNLIKYFHFLVHFPAKMAETLPVDVFVLLAGFLKADPTIVSLAYSCSLLKTTLTPLLVRFVISGATVATFH